MASVLLVAAFAPKTGADSTSSQEYQVKAAFLYNFLQFIDWPEGKSDDSNQPLTIGIVGKDPFGDAFEPIKDKKVKDKSVLVKRFSSLDELKKATENYKTQPETCERCHLLFICPSEQQNLKEILNLVKDYNVLTVGEMKGFLEAGGIINFLVVENKIRFEINTSAAERAKLEIRSQLLRLAKRIVEEDKKAESSEKAGNN